MTIPRPESVPPRRGLLLWALLILAVAFSGGASCPPKPEVDPIAGTVTVVFNVERNSLFEDVPVCTPVDLPFSLNPDDPSAEVVKMKVHVTFKGRRTARARFGCDGGALGPEVTVTYGGGAQDTGCRTKNGRRILVDIRQT